MKNRKRLMNNLLMNVKIKMILLYMKKYGLTADECLGLKRDILIQSNLKFSNQILKYYN